MAVTDLQSYEIIRTSSSGTYSYSVKSVETRPWQCARVRRRLWRYFAFYQLVGEQSTQRSRRDPGTTETGSYNLNGGTSNAALLAVTRNPGSTWVLPTRDEWYKSAYYVGGGDNAGYWLYATQSNSMPSNVLSSTSTNAANFTAPPYTAPTYGQTDVVDGLTPVGAFAASKSYYGTYDQTGDVWQWVETD